MFIHIVSALLLFASGAMITGAGAYFSVKGFLLWVPDEEVHTGLMILGIGFEVAKITASTFLFHEGRNPENGHLFRWVLGPVIVALILLSAVFTYSHLNVSVSQSMEETRVTSAERDRLVAESARLKETVDRLERQQSSLPAETKVGARIRLMKAMEEEKKTANNRLEEIASRVTELDNHVSDTDRFSFLNSVSKLLGVDREKMFTITVLGVVAIIDPLAITIFLAGTVILARVRRSKENVVEAAAKAVAEEARQVEQVAEALSRNEISPEQATVELQVIEDAAEQIVDDVEADQPTEVPVSTRKRLIRIKDYFSKDETGQEK
jgi:biopolymer transport protein ExbB/TolQ